MLSSASCGSRGSSREVELDSLGGTCSTNRPWKSSSWLFTLSKAEDPYCPCNPGATRQTGFHLAFECPLHQHQRSRLLQGRSSWEEVDESSRVRVDAN